MGGGVIEMEREGYSVLICLLIVCIRLLFSDNILGRSPVWRRGGYRDTTFLVFYFTACMNNAPTQQYLFHGALHSNAA